MYTLDEKIKASIDKYFDMAKAHADYITDHPELGGTEKLACAKYKENLEANGWQVETEIKGVPNSFLAIQKSRVNDNGPRAVLMSEYDALPEMGHGCGHSVSGAASMLAALALADAYPDLPIRVDLMGTPGEEFPCYKVDLTDAGAFDGYEFAAMAHMSDSPSCAGFPVLACIDRYITFHGKAAHASGDPEMGLNALNAARIYMDALDMWRQHLPLHSQIHGIVVKGGDLPSIVPDDVELEYWFRARTMKELLANAEKFDKCAEGAALCTGCTVEWEQKYQPTADLSNPPMGLAMINEIFDAMGEKYVDVGEPSGSTDAGNVDQKVVTFHTLVNATGGVETGMHTTAFQSYMKKEEGHQGLYNAATLLANLALRLATEPEKLKEIQAWHKAYRGL